MDSLKQELKTYFGYDNFRNGQEEIVRSILEKNDTLVVMPTGGGKSICYQLPAIILEGTAIVISPLIALMKDQVDAMQANSIPATMINSSLSQTEIQERLTLALNGRYKLLYIAPERLESRVFVDLLKQIKISFVAVDEAHCISEWGHDFRPSYLTIANTLKTLDKVTIVGLTATATPDVQEDIVQSLQMKNPNRFIKGFERKNLRYITEMTDKKAERIVEILKDCKSGSTIIYCGSRKRVEYFADALRDFKFKVESYHAGMNSIVRTAVQDRFINDRAKIIIATNAFGMGIDKSDVRNVIHTDFTQSIEAYYQEAGRAGRDGKQSNCYLLYQHSDINLQEFFLNATYPKNEAFEKIYNHIYDSLNVSRDFVYQGDVLLNALDISNQTGINSKIVSTVLAIFEKYGVLSKNRITNSGKIKFICTRERIIEYFNNVQGEKKEVIEAVLRTVSSEAFHKDVTFSAGEIARKHFISEQVVDSTLKALHFAGLIEYSNPNLEESFSLPLKRMLWYKLPIDFTHLDKRRDFAFKKLNFMLNYAETKECKRNYILKYFKETDFQGVCGNCSTCLNNKMKFIEQTSKFKFVRQELISVVTEFNGKLNENAVVDILKGTKSKYVVSVIAERNRFFAKCKDVSKKDIESEIAKLITEKIIERNYSENNALYLAESGKINISSVPEPYKFMEKADTNTVFNKLVALRRDIAERAGVVPRGIISDVSLRKIAETMPDTEYQLRRISGISQVFVQKFSKLFLTEISKLKTAPKEQKLSKVAQDTLKLINQGLDYQEISKRVFANPTMAAGYIQEIVESGYKVERQRFVDDDTFNKVKEYLIKNPDLQFREAQADIDIDIEMHTLKMVVAFVRRELFDESL